MHSRNMHSAKSDEIQPRRSNEETISEEDGRARNILSNRETFMPVAVTRRNTREDAFQDQLENIVFQTHNNAWLARPRGLEDHTVVSKNLSDLQSKNHEESNMYLRNCCNEQYDDERKYNYMKNGVPSKLTSDISKLTDNKMNMPSLNIRRVSSNRITPKPNSTFTNETFESERKKFYGKTHDLWPNRDNKSLSEVPAKRTAWTQEKMFKPFGDAAAEEHTLSSSSVSLDQIFDDMNCSLEDDSLGSNFMETESRRSAKIRRRPPTPYFCPGDTSSNDEAEVHTLKDRIQDILDRTSQYQRPYKLADFGYVSYVLKY